MTARPRVHFAPKAGWINDPHGLTWYGGRYHLFFQHVPDSLEWRQDIHWGHAISADLLHWEEQPVALRPSDDETGCWSGAVVVGEDGTPRIIYTSAREENLGLGKVRVAKPQDPSLTSWVHGDVLAAAQRDDTEVFRDPMIFRDGDRWRMIVGHGDRDGVGGAEVFSSEDLDSWTYDGLLATRSHEEKDPWTGTAWECPQLARLGDSDVLVVSAWEEGTTHYVVAAHGTYADGRFDADRWQQITAAPGHYAASVFADAEGRQCLIFWIRGIRDGDQWAGVISVPYVVSVDDRIRLTPHPSVEAARRVDGRPGTELDIEWSPTGDGTLRLVGDSQVAELELRDGQLRLAVAGGAEPVVVDHAGPTVRIVVDGPVLEVVADGGLVGLQVATGDGVVPETDAPGRLDWWHLT